LLVVIASVSSTDEGGGKRRADMARQDSLAPEKAAGALSTSAIVTRLVTLEGFQP
jgi:hypothetical protein